MSDTSRTAAGFSRRVFWSLALLPALVSLGVPATVWGDIYKWTDEQGRTNFSNIPPPQAGKAKNVQVVLKETKPASIPDHVATSTEQALLARIESLERQLRAQQYAAQPPEVPPPTPYASYSPPTPLPPPPPSYYSGGFYSSYPSNYPSYYYPVASSHVVYPARTFVSRPAFAPSRGGFSRGGGGHGGGHGGRQ